MNALAVQTHPSLRHETHITAVREVAEYLAGRWSGIRVEYSMDVAPSLLVSWPGGGHVRVGVLAANRIKVSQRTAGRRYVYERVLWNLHNHGHTRVNQPDIWALVDRGAHVATALIVPAADVKGKRTLHLMADPQFSVRSRFRKYSGRWETILAALPRRGGAE